MSLQSTVKVSLCLEVGGSRSVSVYNLMKSNKLCVSRGEAKPQRVSRRFVRDESIHSNREPTNDRFIKLLCKNIIFTVLKWTEWKKGKITLLVSDLRK